jgi:trimethyllysine dioxygenase
VLHGRSAFTGARHMCGAYVGGDEYRSRLTVLRERFAPGVVARETSWHGVVNGRGLWDPAL